MIAFIFVIVAFYCFWSELKFTAEREVEHYLSSITTDGLSKILIWGFGEDVELSSLEDQEEILSHLSKITANMGSHKADTKALGGIVLEIKLIYINGNEEKITLPAFTYPTLLGRQDFYLSIEGEDLWEPFEQYFKLLRN